MLDEDQLNRLIIAAERGDSLERYLSRWQIPLDDVPEARDVWSAVQTRIRSLDAGQTIALVSGGMFDDDFAASLRQAHHSGPSADRASPYTAIPSHVRNASG